MIFGHDNFKNEIVWSYIQVAVHLKKDLLKNMIIYISIANLIIILSNTQKYRRYLLRDKKTGKEIGKDPRKDIVTYHTDKLGTYRLNIMRDVWDDIGIISPNSKNERCGYPTQKPLALLDRIIECSTDEGDIVLDPFCGCATTCISAQRLKRRWIGVDKNEVSFGLIRYRMAKELFGWTSF